MKIIAYLDVCQQEEVFPSPDHKSSPRDPRPEDPEPVTTFKITV